MKSIISLLLISFLVTALNAQNVGIGTTHPDSSAVLDLASTKRVSASPYDLNTTLCHCKACNRATIYNTTNKSLESFNGTAWAASGVTAHFIGESYGGGIVFYVYDNGQNGLIAATADQSTGIQW